MWLEIAILTLQLHNTGTPHDNAQFHTRSGHTLEASAQVQRKDVPTLKSKSASIKEWRFSHNKY